MTNFAFGSLGPASGSAPAGAERVVRVPSIDRNGLLARLWPLPRLLRIVAPAGYGKTTLARALVGRVQAGGVVDLAYARDPIDVIRAAIDVAVAGEREEYRRLVADELLGLGESDADWRAFGRRFLRVRDRPFVMCIENGETLARKPDLRGVVEELLRDAAPALSVIICSRVDPGLRLGRFAGPDDTLVIGADDLRFDRHEIARVFAGVSLDRATAERIAVFTRGWPIVVMMLRSLAKRGRLRDYLDGAGDEADLYGYLADEVYRYLDASARSVLESLAAIPSPTERDLAALFPTFADQLAALERETPFVSRTASGALEVHPAMREMLAQRSDPDEILARLFAALPREDGGLRAAQIALHRGRPRDAAAALTGLDGGYLLSTQSSDLLTVLGAIPSSVLTDFPLLWSNATIGRAFTIEPMSWIEEGERVYEACSPSTPDSARAGVIASLFNAYLNRGRWEEAEHLGRRAVRDAAPEFRHVAQTISDFWLLTMQLYRGRVVDLSQYFERFALFTSNSSGLALTMYDAVARQHRLLGDRLNERAALERAVDIGVASGVPVVQVLVVMDAAFGAWFWGEDALCERYLTQLEALAVPGAARGCDHFIACMRGRAAKVAVGYEKMKTRAYAFVVAAAHEHAHGGAPKRLEYLRDAVVAADHADQPFAQIIARVPLALTLAGPDGDAVFDEAERIAAATDSPALVQAVRAARNGRADGTMLAALTRRFANAPSVRSTARAVIDLHAGTIAIAIARDALVPVRGREAELLTLLALHGVVGREAIADALWPELDGDRSHAVLKTNVSRLRRLAGERGFIVFDDRGYRLAEPPTIFRDGAINPRFARWDWFVRLPTTATAGFHDNG